MTREFFAAFLILIVLEAALYFIWKRLDESVINKYKTASKTGLLNKRKVDESKIIRMELRERGRIKIFVSLISISLVFGMFFVLEKI